MRKLMMALIASAALTAPADAATKTYAHNGVWQNYAGTTNDNNKMICGMSVGNSDNSMMLHVKWVEGKVSVVAFKSSWRIPDGTQVPTEVGFDKTAFGSAIGYGQTAKLPNSLIGMVTIGINDDSMKSFLADFAIANQMWVRFTSGNETPWISGMLGSGAAAESFKMCVREMSKRATQPFSSGGTTQPFSTTPAAPKKTPGEESF